MAKYSSVLLMEKILVRVPKEGALDFIQRQREPVEIPAHYKHGMFVGKISVINADGISEEKPLFLNQHFYGITREDFGRHICATVEVKEKITENGRGFTLEDITKSGNGDFPEFELKISDSIQGGGLGVAIRGIGKFLHFKPIRSKDSVS